LLFVGCVENRIGSLDSEFASICEVARGKCISEKVGRIDGKLGEMGFLREEGLWELKPINGVYN